MIYDNDENDEFCRQLEMIPIYVSRLWYMIMMGMMKFADNMKWYQDNVSRLWYIIMMGIINCVDNLKRYETTPR